MIEFINTTYIQIADKTVVTIGKFDGKHKGHQKIFDVMNDVAKKEKLKTAVFTFYSSLSKVINGVEEKRLTTNSERRRKFIDLGINYLVEYPFDDAMKNMDAKDFVKDILVDKLNCKVVVAGSDCSFGYQKKGNAWLLYQLSKKYNFKVIIIEKEKDERRIDISSTLIRKLLKDGKLNKANNLLQSIYTISGTVKDGNKIGTKLGTPTANIIPARDKYLPKFGVYATKVQILSTGKFYKGLTSVGKNESIEFDSFDHTQRVETYLYDFDGDLYGEDIVVYFYEYIRPEIKFNSLDELKTQMEKDKEIRQRLD